MILETTLFPLVFQPFLFFIKFILVFNLRRFNLNKSLIIRGHILSTKEGNILKKPIL